MATVMHPNPFALNSRIPQPCSILHLRSVPVSMPLPVLTFQSNGVFDFIFLTFLPFRIGSEAHRHRGICSVFQENRAAKLLRPQGEFTQVMLIEIAMRL